MASKESVPQPINQVLAVPPEVLPVAQVQTLSTYLEVVLPLQAARVELSQAVVPPVSAPSREAVARQDRLAKVELALPTTVVVAVVATTVAVAVAPEAIHSTELAAVAVAVPAMSAGLPAAPPRLMSAQAMARSSSPIRRKTSPTFRLRF